LTELIIYSSFWLEKDGSAFAAAVVRSTAAVFLKRFFSLTALPGMLCFLVVFSHVGLLV